MTNNEQSAGEIRLEYNAVVGDWVVVDCDDHIIDAMSWHDIFCATPEEAKQWFNLSYGDRHSRPQQNRSE